MYAEGRGLVAPAAVPVTLTRGILEWLRAEADRQEAARGYEWAADTYRRGLSPQPTFVGMCGEKAVAMYLNQRLGTSLDVDTIDRPRGDGGKDLVVFGRRVQVKTSRRPGVLYVRRETEHGYLCPILWDVCVACSWSPESKSLSVSLHGWINKKKAVEDSDFCHARRGNHQNLEVTYDRLEPMGCLVRKLKCDQERRRLRGC